MSAILIRADANHNIGMGHIMRTLSITDAFSSAGDSVRFVLADDTVSTLVQDRGYETVVLNSNFRYLEEELDLWPLDLQADCLIVDSYYVTGSYLQALKKRVNRHAGKIVYIDDLLAFPYPVDILIDYNAYAFQKDYESLYRNSGVEKPAFILGCTYAPLRSMFRGIEHRSQQKNVTNILITTGGSDELHLTLAILQYLNDRWKSEDGIKMTGGFVYHFLIGAMNGDKEAIYSLASRSENRIRVILHENVSDMKSLISCCDLAISAAGSTLYEISACGVPLITYALADNQIPGGEAFDRLGLGVYAGDLRNPSSIGRTSVMSGVLDRNAVGRILSAADALARDYERRVKIGQCMQSLIDGHGADRIVEEIMKLK